MKLHFDSEMEFIVEVMTEDIYKIYAESFRGADHLRRILEEAQTIVNNALAAAP
jgi:phosphoglucomutase